MPTFEYIGEGTSDPISYTMDGREAPTVGDRVFEPGEHVSAVTSPDESLFALVEQPE